MPNTFGGGHQRQKSQQPVKAVNTSGLVLKQESSSQDAQLNHVNASDDKQRITKLHNSELSSQGTAENTQIGMQATNNVTGSNHRGITHTLGNTLGNQKQSLNMSNYIGYYSAAARDSSLNDRTLAKT